MRLIDADAKMVAQLNDFETESVVEKEMTVDDYLSLSDYDAPTIDAVPVVRCKDCRWRNTIGCDAYVAAQSVYACEDDGFCKWAERKSDD